MSYLNEEMYGTRVTPQSEEMREDQVRNEAGGFVWEVDDFTRLRRWLILGSEGGTYYASEKTSTKQNIDTLNRCLKQDGLRTVGEIVNISQSGRAPKNDQAIFALAAACAARDEITKRAALDAVPLVCRIGTHLFQFVTYVKLFRGWGRGLRNAVAAWYLDTDINKLAYQVVKYREREKWTHADLLRLTHPKTDDSIRNRLFKWIVDDEFVWDKELLGSLEIVEAFLRAQQIKSVNGLVELIKENNLTREMIPSEYLAEPKVWNVLLQKMPMTAMIRNLANMTRIDLLTPHSDATALVVERLNDMDRLRKARVHPMAILLAHSTYAEGRGFRGQNTWGPVTQIVDALDSAFYKAFGNVTPTNKRLLLALDISGSMDGSYVSGSFLTAREASSALALVTAAVEPRTEIVGFYAGDDGWSNGMDRGTSRYSNVTLDGLTPLPISPRQRLSDVIDYTSRLPMGGTDCALPMLYAQEKGREVDAFVALTDSETWAGNIHPMQALQQYRDRTGIPSKLIIVGLTSNGFSIADPDDNNALDVVGMDTATPQLISDFIVGFENLAPTGELEG